MAFGPNPGICPEGSHTPLSPYCRFGSHPTEMNDVWSCAEANCVVTPMREGPNPPPPGTSGLTSPCKLGFAASTSLAFQEEPAVWHRAQA